MADLQTMFKDALSQARAGVTAAEQGAEKVLGRLADAAGFTPVDVRRHARELGEKLAAQRLELTRTIDGAVKKATGAFRLPTKDEVAELRQRVDAITARLDAMDRREGPRA